MNPGTAKSNCWYNPIKCLSKFDCGNDTYIGEPFCSDNLVVRNHLNFACNYPGTSRSFCTNSTSIEIIQRCAEACLNGKCTGIICRNNTDCNDNDIYTEDICMNPGTARSYCLHNSIKCIFDSDCGNSSMSRYCDNSELCIFQSNYSCQNFGKIDSYCINRNSTECEVCDYGCKDNKCNEPPVGVSPVSGRGGCVSQWNCTKWSDCINGVKKRTCNDSCARRTKTESESCPVEKITSLKPKSPVEKIFVNLKNLPAAGFKFPLCWILLIISIMLLLILIIIGD